MNKHFGKLFMKFLMPYLVIMVVMFSCTYIIYFVSSREIENNAINMQEAYMDQSKAVLDRSFKEAMDSSMEIVQVPDVRSFKNKSRTRIEDNYILAANLHYRLDSIKIVSEIIVEYFIFFKNSEVLAGSTAVSFYEKFDERSFESRDLGKDEFWDSMFETYSIGEILPAQEFTVYTKKINGIPMLTTVGYNITEPEATVLVIIDANRLKESMIGFEENYGGNFLIVNDNNEIVVSLNDEVAIKDSIMDLSLLKDDFMIFESDSEVSELHYVLVQPTDEVFKDIEIFRKSGQLLTLIVLIIGLIVSYVLAKINTKPMQSLLTNNEDLNLRVKEQLPYLRRSLLERWLKGTYKTIDEIKSLTKYLKVNFIGELYLVATIDYDIGLDVLEELPESYINDLEIRRLLVKDILTKELLQPEYIHDIDHDKIAVIFVSDSSDQDKFIEQVKDKINECKMALVAEDIRDVVIGVGDVYDDMAEVSTSLSNALEASSVLVPSKELKIFWYQDLVKNNNSVYYPMELENRLVNCTKAGDTDQVEQILRNVLRRNVLEKSLPGPMMKLFIYQIWATLSKVQEQMINNGEVHQIFVNAFSQVESLTELEQIQCCRKAFMDMSYCVHNELEDKHEHLMEDINRYLKENYKNPDFSLIMVSEKFNLSYAYISQLFKDYNKDGFINVLQKLRTEEAKRLLIETNMPVKEIVLECGYNSNNSFGKAFKRLHGVSASVYRERNKA